MVLRKLQLPQGLSVWLGELSCGSVPGTLWLWSSELQKAQLLLKKVGSSENLLR